MYIYIYIFFFLIFFIYFYLFIYFYFIYLFLPFLPGMLDPVCLWRGVFQCRLLKILFQSARHKVCKLCLNK